MSAVKYIAYGLGGMTLATGSFFLFAAISGTPMNQMKVIGDAFEPEKVVERSQEDAASEIEEKLEADTRSPDQIYNHAASPLTAFQIPANGDLDAQYFSELEQRLLTRDEQLDKRERSLDAREKILEESEQQIERMQAELEQIKASMMEQNAELAALADEGSAIERQRAEAEEKSYEKVAPLYRGDPEEVQARLIATYPDPKKAAKVLKHLKETEVAAILSAIYTAKDAQTAAEYGLAYQEEISR